MINSCLGCQSSTVKEIIDLGLQSPSNRYLASAEEICETHRLKLGGCLTCGLVQLIEPMATNMVRSQHEWITYNEPEGHLDDLVARLRDMLTVSGSHFITGVTYKDDSMLARFGKQTTTNTYRLDQESDLKTSAPLASLETIQASLNSKCAKEIASRVGRADIVLVRHILEHAHKPLQFIEACQQLVKPDGVMVFEVPDCRKILDGHDHCFLWEEHISYFTPKTLTALFESSGLIDIDIQIYPYPMEDSLIAIVRNTKSSSRPLKIDPNEISRIESFGASLTARGSAIRNHIQMLQEKGVRTALFGAGHLATKFINFYNLAPLLTGVIDDNPNKEGRFMSGSQLPIISSKCLDNDEIDLCLLTLNPESEAKVLKAKANYLEKGGKFRSIFSASTNSIELDIKHDSY